MFTNCMRPVLSVDLSAADCMCWLCIFILSMKSLRISYLFRWQFHCGADLCVWNIWCSVIFIKFTVSHSISKAVYDFCSRVRGTLGSMLILVYNAGVLFGFVIANYLDYYGQIKINIILPIIFLAAFNYFPETPEYLLKRNQNIVSANDSSPKQFHAQFEFFKKTYPH